MIRNIIPVEQVLPENAKEQINLRFKDLDQRDIDWVTRETLWEEICHIRAKTREALGYTP